MADIAEEEGDAGLAREWLSRAARAPRDRAWVADSIVSDRWAPASPAGKLDAFVWRTPDERLSAPIEAPPPPRPVEIAPFAAPRALEARAVEIIEPARPSPVEIAPAPPIANDIAPTRTDPAAAPANLRVNGFDPLNPPDDPGPHEAQTRKNPYRFFSHG
jgi:HemY protein